jgi:hypothetical protein
MPWTTTKSANAANATIVSNATPATTPARRTVHQVSARIHRRNASLIVLNRVDLAGVLEA